MPTTYSTPAGNGRLTSCLITTSTSVGVSVDGQSSFGMLVIGTSALSGATGVLATITLQKPSFSIASKVATALGVPISVSPSANGTAALAELRDSGGNTVASGFDCWTVRLRSGRNRRLDGVHDQRPRAAYFRHDHHYLSGA